MDACNIAATLPRLARERPDQVAMRCPGRNGRYDVALTYADLDRRSDAIAAGLAKRGIVRGTRTVVMVRPTPEFFLLMFALFKAGAVPVLVDPGIDRRALKQCLDEAEPDAFIGVPLAQFARVVLRWAPSARVRITTGRRAFFADATLADVERTVRAGTSHSDTRNLLRSLDGLCVERLHHLAVRISASGKRCHRMHDVIHTEARIRGQHAKKAAHEQSSSH